MLAHWHFQNQNKQMLVAPSWPAAVRDNQHGCSMAMLMRYKAVNKILIIQDNLQPAHNRPIIGNRHYPILHYLHITKKHNTQSAYKYFWYAEPALHNVTTFTI